LDSWVPRAEEGAEKVEKHIAGAKARFDLTPVMPTLKCRPIKYERFQQPLKPAATPKDHQP
jgi:hypothetical protein